MVYFVEHESDDYFELQCTISELIDEYVSNEILNISSPEFHNELVCQITEILYEQWTDAGICEKTDTIYDEIEEFVIDVSNDYFDNYEIPHRQYEISTVDKLPDHPVIEAKMKNIENAYQPTQRTNEWYEYRHNMMTASNLWKVFGSLAQYNSLIYEKCLPYETHSNYGNVNTESSLHWGVKYEPLSIMLYESLYQTTLGTYGCIQHPKYKFIGASPDGIVNDPSNDRYGRMVEIKNIVNREINGIPKQEYWIQMQIQLETCDLDECDFLETRFKEYENETSFYSDIRSKNNGNDLIVEKIDTTRDEDINIDFIEEEKDNDKNNNDKQPDSYMNESQPSIVEDNPIRGIILHFIEKSFINNSPHYVYMPLDTPIEKEAIDQWIQCKRDEIKSTHGLYKTIYWYLDEYSCILVKRNRAWFHAAIPKIEETWKIIENERITGYEHRGSKKRTRSDLTIETIDENKVITNMPLTGRICLIKMDYDTENAADDNNTNNI